MSHLVIHSMYWDTEGLSVEDCDLPQHVLILNAPVDQEVIHDFLENAFGFRLKSWNFAPFDKSVNTHHNGFFPTDLAVCVYSDI